MTQVTLSKKEEKAVAMKDLRLSLYVLLLKIEDFHDSDINEIQLKSFREVYEELVKIKKSAEPYLALEKREVLYELLNQLARFIRHYEVNLQLNKRKFKGNVDFLQYLLFDLYKHIIENKYYYFETYA